MKVLQIFGLIGYIGIGFIQLFAILDGIEVWLGIPTWLAFVVGVFTAWFPPFGQIVGFFAAWTIWDWNPLGAFALFFWPLILLLIAGMIGGTAATIDTLKRS